MHELHEVFITTPKKKPALQSMRLGNAIYLITERLMNAMCYSLWYPVLGWIFCCFVGSEVLVEDKKLSRKAMRVKYSTFDCTFSVTTDCFKNCRLHIRSSTFSLLFSNCSPSALLSSASCPSFSPVSPLSARNQRHLRRLCTSLFCQAATMFGMVPEGIAS